MKNFKLSLILMLSIFAFVACDKVEADFTFTPAQPKTGQEVVFTNLSTGSEKWEAKSWQWEFGDGGKSTLTNPKYTYKKAGIYDIKLQVDSNKNYVHTKQITVYDSIPVIYTGVDSIGYYQTHTFQALIYNPFGYTITYDWTFSNNAVSASIKDNKSTAAKVDVFFNKKNADETVTLKIKVGSIIDTTLTYKFKVHDVKARSLIMSQKGGNILRQRTFALGIETAAATEIPSGKNPLNILVRNEKLYIFDAGSNVNFNANWATDASGDGNIRVVDLKTNAVTEVVNNNGKSSHFGFYNGYVDANYIYWTDYSEFMYRTAINNTIGNFEWKGNVDAQTTAPYYLATVNRLGYYGNGLSTNQRSGGIAFFDNAYFWAKGGSGRGIYRFMETDILSAAANGSSPVPTLGVILTDFAVHAFVIDQINRKIYFSATGPDTKTGFLGSQS
jgi:PKD repeat protein